MAYITSNRRSDVPPAVLQPQQEPAILLSPEATAKFEVGLTLVLNAWQALAIAVQNQWGGPDSGDKRDWMCGAVAELFAAAPDTDAEDLEDFLLQIMADEFELAVEDDSGVQVATSICRLRAECAAGNYLPVDALEAAYAERLRLRGGGREVAVPVAAVGGGEEEEDGSDDDDDSDSDGGEGEDEEGDVEMDMGDEEVAPRLVQAERSRPERVVDDDGFELVQKGRRKR